MEERKTKRSVLKKQKREEARALASQGAAKTFLRNVPTSPRKMRLMADLIRGERVDKALGILKYHPQHTAEKLEKLLLSAISSWETKNTDLKLEEANLVITEIYVGGGRILKRLRPAPQGRSHRVRKRSNHVTLVVDHVAPPAEEEKKVRKVRTKKETVTE
ncbi:MAG: 50S ribosomal protein L22 [Candidatus Nephrothrix sp. EaCA]|nr:MAG: 50S ribosomal protein L22 [Candidatus Nephrothrix sp. EaCA]